MPLLGYIILNTCVCGLLAALTALFCSKLKKVEKSDLLVDGLPFVSVLVPARNEENNIGRCLSSLVAQDYANFEIIVIDDCSTDKTLSIIEDFAARDSRIKVVNAKEAQFGWLGKCSALVQGVQHAAGSLLVFTDADTCHTRESIRYSTKCILSQKAELISFMPVQELGSFWERVGMPPLLGSYLLGDPLNKVNDLSHPRAYAYGQYFIVSRAAYEAVGGHGSVHDQILDDIVLGRVIKKHGFKIMAVDGTPLYSVRMYKDLKGLWYGLVKNAYTIINCNPLALIGIILLLNTTLVVPPAMAAFLVLQAFAGQTGSIEFFPLISVLTACQLGMIYLWYKLSAQYYRGIAWQHILLLPLGSIFISLLYLESARRVHSGIKTPWKNREYAVSTNMSINGNDLPLMPVNAGDI